jgi:hypothetical protein
MDGIVMEESGLVMGIILTGGNQNNTHEKQGEFLHGYKIKIIIFYMTVS